jgi:hypothetical protein
MNEPENKVAEPTEMEDLKRQCAYLQRQNTIVLAALVGVSLTVTAFILLQSLRANKELRLIRPQAQQVRERAAKEEPSIQMIKSKLVEYGRGHADYGRILQKYQWMSNSVPATHGTKK